jgi:hypothetical protein
LTVANKKLKQKLKKYERVQDAHQEEKLFEVRFYGLPEHKKKELAETLRKFAAELDDGATTDYPPISTYATAFEQQKSVSSTSRFAESGYASMSVSGQNSVTPTNQTSVQNDQSRKQSRSVYNQQQQSIQSYLHDIPAGSNVRGNIPMSNNAKKMLVVRRLEQIFAGKRSAPGIHPQPVQQEEVAQSAATADRQEREATGQYRKPEGSRVARLMPESGKEGYFPHDGENMRNLQPLLQFGESDTTGEISPDQRPTRPLDLDPSRAQLPVENMDYIRHLGFTPPNMDTGDALQEGHGWLYLNLLMNMAQLHTLHVTSDFVKDAILDYSNHLELSRDGRKVRWSGGLGITKNSYDSPSELDSRNSPNDQSLSSKRREAGDRTTDEGPVDPEQRARQEARAKREAELSKFTYKPLFYRKESSEEEEGSYDMDVESSDPLLQPARRMASSSGIVNSALQSGASFGARREDGPMIFYSKAKFCTDLSGDRLTRAVIAPDAYKTVTSHPLGATPSSYRTADRATGLTEQRGPMDASPMDVDSNNGSRMSSSEDDIGFSPAMFGEESSGSDSPAELIDFDASGLGGVQSEDNFAIRVRRSQIQTAPSGTIALHRPSLYSSRIRQALNLPSSLKAKTLSPLKAQRVIKQEILSASRKSLPSSALPPPSFMPFDSTSSGDAEDNSESLTSSEDSSMSGDGSATAFQHPPGNHFAASQTDSDEASEYSDDSDDGSVDFLATARQLDPNTIRNQEREYDAALADRLAEEIVAGSSAATAGGGSGFNTPIGGVGDANMTLKTPGGQGAAVRTPLKRARTSESVPVVDGAKKSRTGE